MSVNLYVGNLPYRVDEESLRQLFTPYGAVESSKVIKDRQTGKSKGFGFIEMASQAEADAAIKGLNETALDGRNVKVSIAKPREERPARRGWDDRAAY
jgi:RNA recognition motif-containing protein